MPQQQRLPLHLVEVEQEVQVQPQPQQQLQLQVVQAVGLEVDPELLHLQLLPLQQEVVQV